MIRKAEPEDAKTVAPLIIQAMGDLAYKFSNSKDYNTALSLFEHFFKENGNQYSYEHTLVYEDRGIIIGSLNAYDGGKLLELRKNFLDYLVFHNNLKDFNPEPETENGEFYLDTISVNPDAQGKGIGKKLIDAGKDWAKKLKLNKVGLLVEIDNNRAIKLYQSKGFKIHNEKTFMGKLYYHMIYTFNDPLAY